MGLGDVVEKVTEATGIKTAFQAFTDDCGCERRKEKLNAMFSFYKKMTAEQKQLWMSWQEEIATGVVSRETQQGINQLYAEVFNRLVRYSTCGMCLEKRIQDLQKVYEQCDQ